MEESKLSPCPFCGSTKIKFSSKTMGDGKNNKYSRRHVAMFCSNCNCYGARTIIEGESHNGSANEGLEKAISAWNNRVEWYSALNYPEDDKWIIVLDENGKEHKDHTWNGHCYYDWIRRDNGDCDGYPTDVKVAKWKYE